MSLFDQLTFGSIVHNGTPIATRGACPASVDAARNRTLYRATLTADLLERREVGEMASWTNGGIRVVPGAGPGNDPFFPGLAFDFETFEDAAGFVRREIVSRLMAGAFDDALERRVSGSPVPAQPGSIPIPESFALAAE